MDENVKKAEAFLEQAKEQKIAKWQEQLQQLIQEMETEGVFLDVSVELSAQGVLPKINIVTK